VSHTIEMLSYGLREGPIGRSADRLSRSQEQEKAKRPELAKSSTRTNKSRPEKEKSDASRRGPGRWAKYLETERFPRQAKAGEVKARLL